jgi:hypothetical protein
VLIANRADLARLADFLTPHPAVIGCEGKKLALYNQPSPKIAVLDCDSVNRNLRATP